MAMMLLVRLWARAGAQDDLIAYEDEVLALLGDHGGRVVERMRTHGGADEPDDRPFEVQVLEFESPAGLESYLADPRRTALADRRDEAIARTELTHVRAV